MFDRKLRQWKNPGISWIRDKIDVQAYAYENNLRRFLVSYM